MISDTIAQSVDFKANLLNINTFDRVSKNTIFLVGLNVYAKKLSNFNNFNTDLIHYEFEIVTSQEKVRSKIISLNKVKTLNVNITFDTQSIELRVENRNEYLIRLTNKDQLGVYEHLLKVNGQFQLNITTLDYSSLLEEDQLDSSIELTSLDYSNFVLLTRKKSQQSILYKNYTLIDQTKTVSFYKSKAHDLVFENEADHDSSMSRILPPFKENSASECFLITRIDIVTNQKLTDFYDCKCNVSMNQNNCTYNKFWTDEAAVNEQQSGHRSFSTDTASQRLAHLQSHQQ